MPTPAAGKPQLQPGAVLMAMGTAVRFTETELRSMAMSLIALDRPVIWKLPQSELPGETLDVALHLEAK